MHQTSTVKQVETYTYLDEIDGEPMEVLLIGVDSQEIGSGNTFEPSGFHREHITTWLRKRYFFLDGIVYAQVPRQFLHYPDIVLDQFDCGSVFATEVTQGAEGIIKIYYPFSESQAVCLTWDTTLDHWSMSVVAQPSDGNIISDRGHASDDDVLWRSP